FAFRVADEIDLVIEPHDAAIQAVAADGRIVWLYDKVYLVRDAEGKARQLRGLMVDITERQRAEEEREQLLQREQAARVQAEQAAEIIRRLQAVTDGALAHLALDDLLREMLARIRELLNVDAAAIL